MACEKCNYQDKKETVVQGVKLCAICNKFAPKNKEDFNKYLNEKLDWKTLDTFRKYNQSLGENQKQGMTEKAKQGLLVTRAPFGYDVIDGKLQPNQDSSKIHSLFKVFLEKDYSLNSLSKNYGFSVNGLKKILSNRTYLGEIKFAGQIHKGHHDPLVSQEIFYAVQRKLKGVMRG